MNRLIIIFKLNKHNMYMHTKGKERRTQRHKETKKTTTKKHIHTHQHRHVPPKTNAGQYGKAGGIWA